MNAEECGLGLPAGLFSFQGCFRRGAFSDNNERRQPTADEEKRFAARSEVGFS
jgi:hypothetical protein